MTEDITITTSIMMHASSSISIMLRRNNRRS